MRRGGLIILTILALGVTARAGLLWCFWEQPPRIDDEQTYSALAENLLADQDFRDGDVRTSIRPPLYPVCLTGIYAVFGAGSYNAVRIVQLGLGLVLVGLVYALARNLYSARVGRWAAAICFLYPSLLVFANLLLTEILFTVLVCLACLAMQRFLTTGRIGALAAVGLLLGLGALTRSVLWMFVPFLFAFVCFAAEAPSWRRRLALATLPVAVFVLTLTPWAVRNTRLQKTFTVVDDMGGRNFMMGNYEHTPLYRTWDAVAIRGDKAWDAVLASENPDYRQLTQGQRDKLAMRRGLAFVMAHPSLTAKRDVVKFFNFWQLERTVVAGMTKGIWGPHSRGAVLAAAAVIFGGYALAILSGVFGFAVLPSADRRMHWFLFLLVAYVCAMHTVVFGHSRYHLSLMPLVFVYSGAALSDLRTLWSRRRQAAFWIASGVSAALALSWVWEIFFVELPRLRGQL